MDELNDVPQTISRFQHLYKNIKVCRQVMTKKINDVALAEMRSICLKRLLPRVLPNGIVSIIYHR